MLKPCTPLGVQESSSARMTPQEACVIVGRSNIVGNPLLNILLQKKKGANAIVTIATQGGGNISGHRSADILVAAMVGGCITGEMIKPGAVVIDCRINRVDDPAARNGYRLV